WSCVLPSASCASLYPYTSLFRSAPVLDGMMFSRMPRPPRQSFCDGPSTTFCLAVAACTVVIRPRLMPHLSLSTLATGARQLVVRSEEHTSELQSRENIVCRLLLE